MPYRLIATDVDGTLLDSAHRLRPRTLRAFEAARAAGLEVVAVSGRQTHSIHAVVRGTTLEGPAIGSNGSVGVHLGTGDVYFEETIPVAAQSELATLLRAAFPGLQAASVRDAGHTFVAEEGYLPLMDPGDHGQDRDAIVTTDLAGVVACPSVKLVLRHPTAEVDDLYRAAVALGVTGCHVTTSGAPFLEVSRAGTTKASGLALLCARLGFAPDEVVAFGDNRNDVEMLQWAGLGVAMGNGVREAREAADAIAASNDEDGLALFLEDLLG